MTEKVEIAEPPSLPSAPSDYSMRFEDERSNIFRLYFNRLTQTLRTMQDRLVDREVVNFQPIAEPSSPAEGDVYFDETSKKLRCYDGTTWNNLF